MIILLVKYVLETLSNASTINSGYKSVYCFDTYTDALGGLTKKTGEQMRNYKLIYIGQYVLIVYQRRNDLFVLVMYNHITVHIPSIYIGLNIATIIIKVKTMGGFDIQF